MHRLNVPLPGREYEILIEKGLLMENVAQQTGFGDYSGFYRAFKQEYGISPRQYRNLHFD